MIVPPKPRPGDRVAVLSPSAGLPEIYPFPYELGLRRLREDFGLVPVEYPTTRTMNASPADRARDVMAAFADPTIRAVLTSIGGDDQIKVLRHLDPAVLRADPKPFLGFSDNTNLLVYLRNLGIVGYHGGAVMTAFGRGGAMHPLTTESLRAALFGTGPYELTPAETYCDEDRDWAVAAQLDSEPDTRPGGGWRWHGDARIVQGRSWGGNIEILDYLLSSGPHVLDNASYEGSVFFLETSEELPSPTYVYRVLMCMGERGLLEQFAAVLVGRPKAWSLEARNPPEVKAAYTEALYAEVLRAVEEYAGDVPVVLGLDFGHTDPQLVVPCGGEVTVDARQRRAWVTY